MGWMLGIEILLTLGLVLEASPSSEALEWVDGMIVG